MTIDAMGKLYAGLGYYHYQNGNMAGDLYTSNNNGTNWQNANTGYVGGVIYSVLAHSSGNVFAASAGIWKSASSGLLWTYSMTGVKVANQTVKIAENSAGHIFVLCKNNALGTRLPYGGVFRSTDNGITWMQLVNGINAQGLFEIFIDSHDNIWLSGSTIRANANGTGTIWGTPELYKSTNNGLNWIKNTSIVTASDAYTHIAETKNGKLYVASSFGTSVSNLSSSNDYNSFDNTLNLPPNNGGYSYGLAVNNANDVFHGTETNGIMRSISNGAPGSFTTVAAGGNTTVYVDPYTQYVFSSAGPNASIHFNCSTNINNGSNMFTLSNFPGFWADTQDMAFTNTGKIYCAVNSSHFNQVGLYLMQSPVTANSSFTMLINFGTLSFYFYSLFIDKCGYLYGIAPGGGISVSTLPVNTPLQSTLNLPANNATGISTTATLSWSAVCTPDSFHLQVATDSLFANVIFDKGNIVVPSYQLQSGSLTGTNHFFWRVYGINAAGRGSWSAISNFSTANLVSCIAGNNTLLTNLAGTSYQWQVNTGSGFADIADNANYAGTNSNTLLLSGAPTSWYGYQYQCLTDGNVGNIFTLKFGETWTGTADSDWNNPLNWNCGQVPDANTDSFITSGNVLVNSTGICRSLESGTGTSFTVNFGINFTITN